MRWLIAAAGALWAVVILWDAFEAIVLPRRVARRFRPTRMLLYQSFSRREVNITLLDALSYYRSQHDNQSWLASLTTMLDASALVVVGVHDACQREAQLTFAMARHAVVDLAQVLALPPRAAAPDRLPPDALARLQARLAASGVHLDLGRAAADKLAEMRRMYEPYVEALSAYLLMPLPPWRAGGPTQENWRTSAWGGALGRPSGDPHEDP